MDVTKHKIGETIKMLRINNNMSQEDLADKLNVTRQTISSWENGRTQPDVEMISNIAALFDISVDEVAYGTTEPKFSERNNQFTLWVAISVVLSIVHLVMSLLGKINTIGVFISVVFASFIALIIHISFESSIKNNDFSMIAGYKKSDSVNLRKYTSQLRLMSKMVSIGALAINVLYIPIYFTEKSIHMRISLIFFAVFLLWIVTTVLLVNYKYNGKQV